MATVYDNAPYLDGPVLPTPSPDSTGGLTADDEDSKDFADSSFYDDFDGPAEAVEKKSRAGCRKGPGGADKRATHNAIERARRESLNGRFMTLAEALPSISTVKRPSKSLIVNKALDFVYEAQTREYALVKENNDLRQELDQLRQKLGMCPLPPPAPLPGSQPTTQAQPAAYAPVPAPAQQQPAVQHLPSPTATPAGSPALPHSQVEMSASQPVAAPVQSGTPVPQQQQAQQHPLGGLDASLYDHTLASTVASYNPFLANVDFLAGMNGAGFVPGVTAGHFASGAALIGAHQVQQQQHAALLAAHLQHSATVQHHHYADPGFGMLNGASASPFLGLGRVESFLA